MSEVDVIVLDVDGAEHLSRCIASIAAQTDPPARVIVFDNGSSVPVASRLQIPDGLRVDIIRNEKNLGFSQGINVAMRSVTAPFVAWLNNDVVLEPAWLETLLTRLVRDPLLGGVQSRILKPDGSIDGAGIDISDGTYRQLGHGQPSLDEADRSRFWGVSGTAALFRAAALHAVTLDGQLVLHPAFFAWYEDVELAARLRESGWRLELVDEPLATHVGSVTAERLGDWGRQIRIRNRYLVRRLHPGVGRRVALLVEDIARMFRQARAGDFHGVMLTAGAVFEGVFGRIDATWRGRQDF